MAKQKTLIVVFKENMKKSRERILWELLTHLFLHPLVVWLIYDHFQERFNLPVFGYWEVFFILFGFRTSVQKMYQETKTEWLQAAE